MPNDDELVSLELCASVREQNGKYAVLMHWGDGEPITQTKFRFDTEDEARRASVTMLAQGIAWLKVHGAKKARRPKA